MYQTRSWQTIILLITGLVFGWLYLVTYYQSPILIFPFQPINWQWFLDLPGQDAINPGVQAAILPHDSASHKELTQFYRGLAAVSQPTTVVILSPNHYDAGRADIQATTRAFQTIDGLLYSDTPIINQLRRHGLLGVEGKSFDKEHGVTMQAGYIKRFFPQAKVVPLIFKADTSLQQVDALVERLIQIVSTEARLVLASIDFSHYLPKTQADLNDARTLSQIKAMDLNQLPIVDEECAFLDSPPALRAIIGYANQLRAIQLAVVRHDNTADILNRPSEPSTTSHFYITFAGS